MEVVVRITLVFLSLLCIYLVYMLRKQRRDIYTLVEQIEVCLDELLNEKEVHVVEIEEDSLWNKIQYKLSRVSNVFKRKTEEVRLERNQMKELISDISHQTKIPIANIKLYLEILHNEVDEHQLDFLSKVDRQIDKLDFLLQSMVKMSRLETGIIEIHRSVSCVMETLAIAVSNVMPKADQKHIQVYVDCDERIYLSHDVKWSAEAIFNILDNAIKYTDENGFVHVIVEEQELFTCISIQDTGKGIASDRFAKVFTRFYREPEIHDSEGIGVGLFLARKIIMLQEGYIELQSKVKEGSIFKIYFPR